MMAYSNGYNGNLIIFNSNPFTDHILIRYHPNQEDVS
jgi:hypothetical protein